MEFQSLLIPGVIIAAGIFICLFLIFRSKRKVDAIKHYEKLRDSLSLRKIKVKNKTIKKAGEGDFVSSIQSIVTGLVLISITLTIGFFIMGELSSVLEDSSQAANISNSVSVDLAEATSSIFPVIMILLIVGMVMMVLGRSRLLFDGEYNQQVKEAKEGIKHYKGMRDKLSSR